MKNNAHVHVAVALIIKNQQVLISLRAAHVHQGNLWEFPGGKLEKDETAQQALCREIKEELDIDVLSSQNFMRIQHDYGDQSVLLDVLRVDDFAGEPRGVEGQKIKWQAINHLQAEDFPAANRIIVHRLICSDQYLITGTFSSLNDFQHKLIRSLNKSPKIVQLRCKSVSNAEYQQLAQVAAKICRQHGMILLLNTSVNMFQKLSDDAQGLHLSSSRLFEFNERPINMDKILSVSCHSVLEIEQAKKLQADIVLISPVKKTSSHPTAKAIGWDTFKTLAKNIEVPVYALGGMKNEDIMIAQSFSAQGVAAISEFWSA